MATLTTLVFGILSLRGNRAQPKESKRSAEPGLAARSPVTAMLMKDDTEAAIQKLREEAKGCDSQALPSLVAALLTHRLTRVWSSDPEKVPMALEALVAARKAIARSPRMAAAHFNLALALDQLGFTPEARVEFETAATLESDAARSAEARQRARELRSSGPLAASIAATRYIRATAFPESHAILKEYSEARERSSDLSHWNGADVHARLERAAKLYGSALLYPELLPRVFLQVAIVLSPHDQSDLYMQRYLIAGGLHREGRSGEAIALLRAIDIDVLRAHGQAGRTVQIVCEKAIARIVHRSPVEALDLLRDAFHESAAKGEPRLTALYASLLNEIRTDLLQSALRDRDIPTALEYTDASVFSPPREHSGKVHEDAPDPEIAATDVRLIKYGDFLEALKDCRERGLNDFGLIAQPKKSSVIAPSRKSAGETQHALTLDAAIVEYATVHDQVVAFVIRRNDIQSVFLYASAADVRNAADAMRRANEESFAAAAGRLYELILAPVAERLEGVSTIAFVAYRDLAGIPFGALLDVQGGQFLIERLAVVHAQSTRAAITASRALKPARAPKVLAIAATDFDRERYPDASVLSGARREADSIATLSHCARLLAGPAATAEAIQRQLVENVVIHYAGHIVRRGADVWLPLMPAAGRDGLSAREIAQLPLKNARVVVLAACKGASPGDADELMPTMADAFLTAGVPVVIASSYDVDDSDAPATMRRLHTYLRDGDDAADALRKTAMDELRRGRCVPLSLRFMAIGGAASLAN